MNLKRIIIIISLFLLGFISVIVVDMYLSHPAEQVSFQPTAPSPTPVTLLLPQNAYLGKLTSATGIVKRMPWDQTSFEPATVGATLYHADELATTATSSALFTIDSLITGQMQKSTHITFGSLIPNKLAIRQISGTGEYTLSDPAQNLSVKALSALVVLEQGTVTISIEDKIIAVTLLNGMAKLGYINNDNITQEWELTGNDSAVINDTTGNVRTTGVLVSHNNQ